MENQTEGSQIKIPARRRSSREIEEWIERYRPERPKCSGLRLGPWAASGQLARVALPQRASDEKSSTTMIPVSVTDTREAVAAVTL